MSCYALIRHCARLFFVLAGGGWLFVASAFGQPLEIHELDADPAPHIGTKITVHGRLRSAGAGHLQLEGSALDVRYSQPRLPLRVDTTHVEVTGRLAREQGGLVLHAEMMAPLPSEATEFANRRQRISPDDFSSLFELSRWARDRAKWYQDSDLRDLATQSYRQAFAWEEDTLAQRNQWDGLLELAKRGETLGLEPEEVQRIRYRALVSKQARLPARDVAARQSLAGEVRRLLPGTDKPAKSAVDRPPKLNAPDQIAHYADTPAPQRVGSHRALWAALIADALELRAEEAEPDWFELGREASRQIPEREDLARRFELAGWRRQAAGPARLTREELLATRDGLTQLDHAEEAQALVNEWLKHRRVALPANDAEERVVLAEDFISLADEREAAAELYREALAIAPRFDAAEAGLRRVGYEQVGGVWRRVSELSENGVGSGEALIRPGDSEGDLIRRLRRPDRITRTASRNGILEQWSYDGPPALIVYLRRGVTGGSASVTHVASH